LYSLATFPGLCFCYVGYKTVLVVPVGDLFIKAIFFTVLPNGSAVSFTPVAYVEFKLVEDPVILSRVLFHYLGAAVAQAV
jgi:hypothetical protein